MIYYIAGLSLTRIPSLAAYKRAWRIFVGYAKRIRETSFTSHFKKRTAIYGVVNHTIYMQEYFGFAEDTRLGRVCETQISKNTQAYRSGHNEAVLKICRSIGRIKAETP